jgi:hypothetical protein
VLLALFFKPWSKEFIDLAPNENERLIAYHVVEISGKGMGVIATRDITRGELLYRESPLFIIPSKSGCQYVDSR